MKINFVKGFDRLAILLSIPLALFGFKYIHYEYVMKNAVEVVYLESDREESKAIYDQLIAEGESGIFPISMRFKCSPGAVLAKDKDELIKRVHSSPSLKVAYVRAVRLGGDAEGMLVNGKDYGINNQDQLYLLPRLSKRLGVGILGALGFGGGIILLIGIVSRSFRWVCRGFSS